MTCFLVVGYPRTGTSLVAGILHKLGVFMGERFPAPIDANPTGFWVDLDIEQGSNLAATVAKRDALPLWGYKGYRWGAVRAATKHEVKIIGTRRPAEKAITSFQRAFDETADVALQMRGGELPADYVVDYERLIQHPSELDRLAEFVRLPVTSEARELINPAYWRVR